MTLDGLQVPLRSLKQLDEGPLLEGYHLVN